MVMALRTRFDHEKPKSENLRPGELRLKKHFQLGEGLGGGGSGKGTG
jgi:hypothetical protein